MGSFFLTLPVGGDDKRSPWHSPQKFHGLVICIGGRCGKYLREKLHCDKRENAVQHAPWFESDPVNQLDAAAVAEMLHHGKYGTSQSFMIHSRHPKKTRGLVDNVKNAKMSD